MEIEKKYLVDRIPEDLEQYEKRELEQCYLCERRMDDDYILTYKNRPEESGKGDQPLCVAQELEASLTREAYEHLKEKADGICIKKTRYRIPYKKYMIELDLFHDSYDGFCLAEVEFDSVEEGRSFQPPEWFGRDVSGDCRFSNSYMALHIC